MGTTETITVVLLAISVLFLFMLLLAVVRAGGCLQRLEQMLAERDSASATDGMAPPVTMPANDGAFMEFLAEESSRRKLPKREQFEAYRLWRKEKGLNWSPP